MSTTSPTSADILPVLQDVLKYLQTNPHPHVPTPAGCKKRASVAIVIRICPAFKPVELGEASIVEVKDDVKPARDFDEFFSQGWVQEGDPEVLFIKRAGRPGDRWSGHIALPGGKRDPEDEGDAAAAVREAREEVGVDLSSDFCLYGGNLPERIVATTWGRQALMVLCPYIYVLTSKDTPRVLPQPTEVASAHWVPLRALLSEALRTREYVDTSSRMAQQGGPVLRYILRAVLGKMVFSAINLLPSESIYASSIEGFIPPRKEGLLAEFAFGAFSRSVSPRRLTHQQPLLLWGLTLGVLADFLDMLPPYNAVRLWRYPTFTPPDLQLFIYVFTYGVRKAQDNPGDFSAGTWPYRTRRPSCGNQTAIDATTEAMVVTEAEPTRRLQALASQYQNEVGISGTGVGTHPNDAVGKLLAGYYERVNIAVAAFIAYRATLGFGVGYWLFKLWRKRKLSA